MADKKLSSVSAVSDMNYVYAETASGETVKISKADLASVVAGLFRDANLYPFMKRSVLANQESSNNLSQDGIYHIANWNTPVNYGMMLQFSSGGMVTQIVIGFQNRGMWYRSNWNSEGWTNYVSLI